MKLTKEILESHGASEYQVSNFVMAFPEGMEPDESLLHRGFQLEKLEALLSPGLREYYLSVKERELAKLQALRKELLIAFDAFRLTQEEYYEDRENANRLHDKFEAILISSALRLQED